MAFSLNLRTSFLRAVLLLILFAGICVPQTNTVWGDSYSVDNYDDLVQALKIANGSNTPVEIIIAKSITLKGELPAITKGVTIKADPHQPLGSIEIDGAGKYRGLYINSSDPSDPVEINGLNFVHCTANGSDGGDDASGGSGGLGGAIYVENGDVTLKDVHFQNNTARGGDGGKAVYDGPSSGGGNSEFGNGGSGAYDDADSRQGGIGAGDGGMQEAVYDPQRDQTSQAERTGGGGLGAGGAVFAEGGTIKFEYTQDYYDKYADSQNGTTNPFQRNTSAGGSGGGGTAGDGDALGDGIFLLKGGIVFTTTAGKTLRIASSIDGVAAASNLDWDDPETYKEIRDHYYGTFTVAGGGTLELTGNNTITAVVNITDNSTLTANSTGNALGQYASVVIGDTGTLEIKRSETIGYLEGVAGTTVKLGGGKTLTIAGNEGEDPNKPGMKINPFTGLSFEEFAGTIQGDNDGTTKEHLVKTGTGRLILRGDNKTPNEYNGTHTDYFDVTIFQGTIEVRDSNDALGGGDVYSKNVDFGTGANLRNSLEAGTTGLDIANNIHIETGETINGTKVHYNGFVVGGKSLTLSGQITGGNLIVNMADAADTLNLSNTDSDARNSYAETRISKGIVAVHDIGGGTANTLGNGAVRLLATGEGGLKAMETGTDITQNLIIDSVRQMQLTSDSVDYTISGSTSGTGGINVNMGSNTLTMSGNLNHQGLTTITGGTLKVTQDATFYGGLSGAGTLDSDGRNITIAGSGSSKFSGTFILGTGTLTKTGTGWWTYDNGSADLPAITVNNGTFEIGTSAASNNRVKDVVLTGNGKLSLAGNTTLENLSSSSRGNSVSVGNHTLTLEGNGGADFYGSFSGSGTVTFEPTGSTDWNLYGYSNGFSGEFNVNSNANVYAKYFNALGDGTATVNLNGGTLGVDIPNYTGGVQIGMLKIDDDSTVDVRQTYAPLFTKGIDTNGQTLTKTGNGYLVVNGGNSSSSGGSIDLEQGGIWLQKYTDSGTTKYDASLGGATIRVTGENTFLNADTDSDTTNTKTLANEIVFDSGTRWLTVSTDIGNLKLSGAITGSNSDSSLVFGGTGTKILSNLGNTFSGNVFAAAGTLELQSDLSSASVTVGNGATLSGNNTTVQNLAFDSGSTFLADVSAGSGQTMTVSGDLVIADGAVAYIFSDGQDVSLLTSGSFNLINVTGNYSGHFNMLDDILGKRAVGDWSGNDYVVKFEDVDYETAASTKAQRSMAAYLTQLAESEEEPAAAQSASVNRSLARSAGLDALLNQVEALANPQMAYAYDEFSGEIYSSLGPAQVQATTEIFGLLSRNLRMVSGREGNTLDSRPGGNDLSTLVRGQSYAGSGWTGWMAATGMFGDTSSNRDRYGYDYSSYGGIVAVERTSSGPGRLGLFYSYNQTKIDTNQSIGSGRSKDNFIGIYGRLFDSAGYTSVIGGFGFDHYDVHRNVLAGTSQAAFLSDSFGGWQGGLYAERGLPVLQMRNTGFQPFFGLQYLHLAHNSINESGLLHSGTASAARLFGKSADMNSLRTNLGARLVHDLRLKRGALQLEGNVSWMHETLDDTMETTFRFDVTNPGSFLTMGNSLGRDWLNAGLGADFALNDRLSLFGSYNLSFNKYQALNTANAGLKFIW